MADEVTSGAPDAASLMGQIIDSQGSGGGEPSPAPVPAPAPAPQPPAATAEPPAPADPNQPPADEQPAESVANWYEALLAQDQDQPDELATLLNEETFNGLSGNAEGLAAWSKKAFDHLRRLNEVAEREKTLGGSIERVGGWEDAPRALEIYGDLFRGDIELTEEDRADFPEAQTHAERALFRMMQHDKQAAYSLGAAVLNHMPELLTQEWTDENGVKHSNVGYILRTLGYDPKYANDYRRVAESGGLQPMANQQEVVDWFKESGIPLDQLSTFNRLPIDLQKDMLAGSLGAAKFHLQEYHDRFTERDQRARAEEAHRHQESVRLEYESAKTLGAEQRKVFDEYVQKGKALGLNDLEAAGLAAMAYAEIEGGYWDENSEPRKVVDRWHGYIKSGNRLQKESGRAGYRKAFEQAYRKAAGQYKSPRPGVPPAPTQPQPRPTGATNGNNQPQFTPPTPPVDDLNKLSGAELMDAILRRQGAIQ
jgi:hypothetical protein